MPIATHYRAVLFDFDGTLADSYDAITSSVNHVRGLHRLPALPVDQIRGLVGKGLLQLMKDVIPGGDAVNDAKAYQAHHPSVMFEKTRFLPRVAETLVALHQAGIKLGVCSNKPVAITRQLLTALQVSHLFDVVLGPEDSGKPKPDPKMLQIGMEKLGVSTNEAIFVGDMPIDVETARNAGVAVWVLPTGSSDQATLEAAKPDRILSNMFELLALMIKSQSDSRGHE